MFGVQDLIQRHSVLWLAACAACNVLAGDCPAGRAAVSSSQRDQLLPIPGAP
jgi:hypothetical protein